MLLNEMFIWAVDIFEENIEESRKIIPALLKLGSDPHYFNEKGDNCLTRAITQNQREAAFYLIEDRFIPDLTKIIDPKGLTVLHLACSRNDSRMVESILRSVLTFGYDPDHNPENTLLQRKRAVEKLH